MLDFLQKEVFGNEIQSYLLFLIVFVGMFVIFRIFRLVLIDRLKVFFEKTKNDFDDFVIEVISGVSKFFY
jgi:hypothetical protein